MYISANDLKTNTYDFSLKQKLRKDPCNELSTNDNSVHLMERTGTYFKVDN